MQIIHNNICNTNKKTYKMKNLKKHIILLVFLITMPLLKIDACEINELLKPSNNIPKKYIGFGLKYGTRSMKSDVGVLAINFIDDSQVKKAYSFNTITEEKFKGTGFQIDFNWGKYNGISSSLMFDIMLGKYDGGLFGYSIGWNFPISIGQNFFLVRPAIIGLVGNYGYSFGKLNVYSPQIQIKNTVFDPNIEIGTSSQIYAYGPLTDLRFSISNKYHVIAQIVYLFTTDNNNVELNFNSGKSKSETKKTDQNNYISFNDHIVNSLPYDASGIKFSIGLAYSFNIY